MTAVSYLRRSSAVAKGANDVSFDQQRAAITSLATGRGDLIAEEFSDHAKSGGSTNGRTGYAKMLDAIRSGRVTTLYAYSLSRLTRSLADLMDLTRLAAKHGVVIRTSQEAIDTSNASGRGFLSILGAVYEMEREWGVERNKAAVATKRARGIALGRQVYGSKPGEDPADVRAAFVATGSFTKTAERLNETGVPSRSGRPWTHASVSMIVRREWPDLAPSHRARRGAAPVGGALLSGLLVCPTCGTTLTPSRNEGKVRGYYCRLAYTVPHAKAYIGKSDLHEWAKAEAARLRVPYEAVEVVEGAAKERRFIEAKLGRAKRLYVEGDLDVEEFDAIRSETHGALAALDAKTKAVAVPEIDWNLPDAEVNVVLLALWRSIRLGPDFRAVEAEWAVPEWRNDKDPV